MGIPFHKPILLLLGLTLVLYSCTVWRSSRRAGTGCPLQLYALWRAATTFLTGLIFVADYALSSLPVLREQVQLVLGLGVLLVTAGGTAVLFGGCPIYCRWLTPDQRACQPPASGHQLVQENADDDESR